MFVNIFGQWLTNIDVEDQPLVDDFPWETAGFPHLCQFTLGYNLSLVGGFKHFLFSTIYGIILPID